MNRSAFLTSDRPLGSGGPLGNVRQQPGLLPADSETGSAGVERPHTAGRRPPTAALSALPPPRPACCRWTRKPGWPIESKRESKRERERERERERLADLERARLVPIGRCPSAPALHSYSPGLSVSTRKRGAQRLGRWPGRLQPDRPCGPRLGRHGAIDPGNFGPNGPSGWPSSVHLLIQLC